ncbi:MAG TPA: MFS transporter [Thermoanaerobaculia bacterium]|nr:MFS transporter [Thermoanaerobaculia bacterium]HMF10634.1 MFS transporter [Thermoanaerobaculia bacterium]
MSPYVDRFNPWRGLRGLPREVWVLSLATLINKAGSMVLAFLALYLTRQLGFSVGTAANVLFLYGAGALVAAPVSGILSDRLGPIRIMRGSLLLAGLVMLVFPLARSLAPVIALTLALSVLGEAFRPANLTIFGDLVRPDQRKAGFALNRLAINLGMSIGPAVGGFLAAISFGWLFLVNGTTSILAGLVLVMATFPLHRHHAEGTEIEAAVSPLVHRTPGYRDPTLLFFLAGVLPVAIILFQHLASMSVFLVNTLKLSEASYGALFTLNCLLIVFLEVPINIATAHWPHRRTLALGALLFGIGFGGLAFAWDFWSAAATVVVWTFGEMFFFPGMAAYLTDIAPVSRRGEYMGLSQMVMGLAFMIGPWAGMLVLDRFGPKTLWLSTFGLGLGAALLMSRLGEPAHVSAPSALPSPTAAPSVEP